MNDIDIMNLSPQLRATIEMFFSLTADAKRTLRGFGLDDRMEGDCLKYLDKADSIIKKMIMNHKRELDSRYC